MTARAAGVLAAGLLLVAPTAGASSTPGASSAPGPPVVAESEELGTPAEAVVEPFTAEVQPFTAEVQPFRAVVESLDGAVTDIGDREFRLASDVLFAFDKANLTPRATKELNRIAGLIKAQAADPVNPVRTVAVEGHTDGQGTGAYNVDLSNRRAESVRAALSAALPGITVTASGKGETEPIASNETEAGQAKNRRVEIAAGD